MLIKEILANSNLAESVSLASTLKLLTSELGNPIAEVYRTLNTAADDWFGNNRNMNGYEAMRERNITARWYQEDGDSVVSHLHALADQAHSQNSSALRRALRDNTTANLRDMAETIAPILVRIARDVGSATLESRARDWISSDRAYAAHVEQLKAENEPTSGSKRGTQHQAIGPSYAQKKDAETQAKQAAQAQQRAQAEKMVNTILAQLPTSVRGEIRNSIARDNNRLYALQRELDRRNIRLESRVHTMLDRVRV
jgi:hypothetical protein